MALVKRKFIETVVLVFDEDRNTGVRTLRGAHQEPILDVYDDETGISDPDLSRPLPPEPLTAAAIEAAVAVDGPLVAALLAQNAALLQQIEQLNAQLQSNAAIIDE